MVCFLILMAMYCHGKPDSSFSDAPMSDKHDNKFDNSLSDQFKLFFQSHIVHACYSCIIFLVILSSPVSIFMTTGS